MDLHLAGLDFKSRVELLLINLTKMISLMDLFYLGATADMK